MLDIKNNVISLEAFNLFKNYFKLSDKYNIVIEEGNANTIKKQGLEVKITCIKPVYAFRMLSFLLNNDDDKVDINEVPSSYNLTYYTDCSRNGVINFEFFKEQIYLLAANGYNRLGLYTEDTYEVDNEPYFGHLRGRFSKQEIKEMVKFAKMFGIELIPAIATFAHMENIFFWTEYEPIRDNGDIVQIDNERTYVLIENIFKTLAECYESREVHIGFDEAHFACLGYYFDKHGVVDRTEAVCRHLRRVLDIAKKYGFNCSVWSDMFFRLEYKTYYPELDAPKFSEKTLSLIPKDVKLIYWDYYHPDKKVYDKMIERHMEIGNPLGFAGGSWNWLGYAPLNQHAFDNSKPAIMSCKEHKVDEIYVTAWGDNGNECSRLAVLPTMFLYGEYLNSGKIDDETISNRLKMVTKLSLQDYFVLDKINERPGNERMKFGLSNPAKYIVYNDPFNGAFDYHISDLDITETKKVLEEIKKINYQGTILEKTFNTAVSLCNLIINKCMIGNWIYKAYQEKNYKEIKRLYSKVIPTIIKSYKDFLNKLRIQWTRENKLIGFEVLEGRLSYQFIRLEESIMILKDFYKKKITTIESLEQPKLSQKYAWEDDRYVYKHNYIQMANVFMNK